MITTKRDLKEYLSYEKTNYKIGGGIKHVIKVIAANENDIIWNFQRRLRITEYHKNAGHKIRYAFNIMILNRKRNKYGLHISLNVFGKGLKIMHLGPILTNGNARVGEDCAIHINTALVAQGVDDGAPTVGNYTVIGVGAILLGNIKIADGIAVGAGAVVNKSFEEDDIAIAGVPAKKISENGRKSWNRINKNSEKGSVI